MNRYKFPSVSNYQPSRKGKNTCEVIIGADFFIKNKAAITESRVPPIKF